MVGKGAFLGAVKLVPYRPRHARPFIGQSPLVDVRPDIKIDIPKIAPVINVELGGLPLSLGLFAGSALLFYLKGHVPDGWAKTAALISGAGLAAAGIVNLMIPKAKAAAVPSGAPGATVPAPAPSSPGGGVTATQAYSASNAMAFENVTGRISQPKDFSTVSVGWFKKSYPVRIQIVNAATVPVTFDLELVAEEDPAPIGQHVTSTKSVQVSVPAAEAPGSPRVENIDVDMPIADWGTLVDYSDVILTARKRRVPGEDALLLDMKSFVLE